MAKIRKPGYFVWSEKAVASNSLSVVGGDLLSRNASGFIVKSTVAATTPKIIGIATGEKTFASDNQTVDKKVIDFPVVNDEMRVELPTVTDLAQANVGWLFDINASQVVVLTAAWTQLQLIEIISTRVGSFKILA